MSRFIDSLESRHLLSVTPVTKATLSADAAHVAADAVAAKADLKSLSVTIAADSKSIQAAMKGLPKSNAALFNTLKSDEGKLFALITKDLAALTGPASALAKRSAAAGEALMLKGTTANQAKVNADVAALGTILSAPLAKLASDEHNSNLDAVLQTIASANASDAALLADLTRQSNDTNDKGSIFTGATAQFQTDLGTLAADLAAAPAGSAGAGSQSSLPNLVGTYSGSSTQTAGSHVGRVQAASVTISTEGVDGSLTGSITVTESGQSATFALIGSITVAGKFTATFTDDSATTSTLSGTGSAHSIKGTYSSSGGSRGTFSVTK